MVTMGILAFHVSTDVFCFSMIPVTLPCHSSSQISCCPPTHYSRYFSIMCHLDGKISFLNLQITNPIWIHEDFLEFDAHTYTHTCCCMALELGLTSFDADVKCWFASLPVTEAPFKKVNIFADRHYMEVTLSGRYYMSVLRIIMVCQLNLYGKLRTVPFFSY